MADAQFSVSWDEYQKNICKGFGALQQKDLHQLIIHQRGEFVDMTIAADGHYIKVHQMVLALISPFIKELISSAAQCPHPVIFLNKVSYQTLQSILEYAYTGEVVVRRDKLPEFLEACIALNIRGLESTTKIAKNNVIMNAEEAVTSLTDKKEDSWTFNEADNHPNTEECNPLATEDLFHKEKHLESPLYHSDEDDVIVEENREPAVERKKENAPVDKLPTFQYSVSCQGNLQMVLNRYVYSLKHVRKNNERYWRCIYQQRLSCPAHVATRGDTILERVSAHNHAFHDSEILKRVRNRNIFKTLNEVDHVAATKRRKMKENDLEASIFK